MLERGRECHAKPARIFAPGPRRAGPLSAAGAVTPTASLIARRRSRGPAKPVARGVCRVPPLSLALTYSKMQPSPGRRIATVSDLRREALRRSRPSRLPCGAVAVQSSADPSGSERSPSGRTSLYQAESGSGPGALLDVVHARARLLGLAASDVGDGGGAEDVSERIHTFSPDAAG